ncbi:MAG: tetratricopeptide repeat protein [Myxococcota bacterium]
MSGLDDEIARLARRVRAEPRSTAFVALADACRRAGRLDEAMRVLREGFRVHPDHAAGRVVLARVHLDGGSRGRAREVLEEVVRADPENLAAAGLLARIWLEEGRMDEARPVVERLRVLAPDDPAVALYARMREAAAPAALRTDDPFDHPALARRFARDGHYTKAAAVWRRIEAKAGDDPTVQRAIAALERAAAGLGDLDEERPGPRGPLPGLVSVLDALKDDDDGPDAPCPAKGKAAAIWKAG